MICPFCKRKIEWGMANCPKCKFPVTVNFTKLPPDAKELDDYISFRGEKELLELLFGANSIDRNLYAHPRPKPEKKSVFDFSWFWGKDED